MDFRDDGRLHRRAFLRNAGFAGGLGAFGTAPAAGSMAINSTDEDEMVDLGEVWSELTGLVKDKFIDWFKTALGNSLTLNDLLDRLDAELDAAEHLQDLQFLAENVDSIAESIAEASDDESDDSGGNGRLAASNAGAAVARTGTGSGTVARTTSPSSPIDLSMDDVGDVVPDIDFTTGDIAEALEDASDAVLEKAKDILSEFPNPLDLLAEAIDKLVDLIIDNVPDLSDLASSFENGATNINFDIIPDGLLGSASFQPDVNVPIDAWPGSDDAFANVSATPQSSTGTATGAPSTPQSSLQGAAGQQATPIKFKECGQADGSVVAFPFEFGTSTQTQSSVWVGLEPHSPNCLYMGIDPETGDRLTADELLDRRDDTHSDLMQEIERFETAIDELETFFDEDENGLVVPEHTDLTLRELDATVTATSYIVAELFNELEKRGYRDDFEYDPDRYVDVTETLFLTISEHYDHYREFDPDFAGVPTDDDGRPLFTPVVSDLKSELGETLETVDFDDLYATAVRFENGLHELIDESRAVRIATPRRVDEDGTEMLDTLEAIAGQLDEAESDEADLAVDLASLTASLYEFLAAEDNGLDLTDDLEALLGDDRNADADFIEELRALLTELETTDFDDDGVTFVDQMPNVTCGRCCYRYDTSLAVDRVASAAKWIANLLWNAISYAWDTISDIDDWLRDKLTSHHLINDFWYRVLSIIVVILLIIAVVLIGWKIGIVGVVAGVGRAVLHASKGALVRLLQNAKVWKQLIRVLLSSDVSCSAA